MLSDGDSASVEKIESDDSADDAIKTSTGAEIHIFIQTVSNQCYFSILYSLYTIIVFIHIFN